MALRISLWNATKLLTTGTTVVIVLEFGLHLKANLSVPGHGQILGEDTVSFEAEHVEIMLCSACIGRLEKELKLVHEQESVDDFTNVRHCRNRHTTLRSKVILSADICTLTRGTV